MGKIFVLMGKSATGKNSIYRKLQTNEGLGLITVVPYTTRPLRENEAEGIDYHFVALSELERMEAEKKVIERRVYQTVHGPWHYFTAADGQIDLVRGDYLLIATLEAFIGLREYFGESNVVPVYIEVPEKERIHRAVAREDIQLEPKYKEMCRRYLMDEEDFSEDKLASCSITRRYRNLDLNQCTGEIIRDITLQKTSPAFSEADSGYTL